MAYHVASGSVNLQATLSAASAMGTAATQPIPHHPITCQGDLFYLEDNRFACEHTEVPADDLRTRAALNASVATLLIELASRL